MRLLTNRGMLFVSPLLLCLCAGSPAEADAAVFRDRAQFEAAAQNLRTLDIENQNPRELPSIAEIDDLRSEKALHTYS